MRQIEKGRSGKKKKSEARASETEPEARLQSEVAEFPNAWLKERFGVRKFRVRGLRKARSELLWAMLAYNVRAWIRLVWQQPEGACAQLPAGVA